MVILGARNELSQALSGSTNVPLLTRDDQVSLDRTIADWLATAPGISLNGQGGLFQSYSLRGLSRARIRTEIDGVPIVTDRPAGNAIGFLPPFLLQSVSGVMGPVSALYGSEAMGGVITLKPQWFS
ncbi:MAG: TonB-dependent receptor plug domain-containing protein, partial [Halieaceae bacterium]